MTCLKKIECAHCGKYITKNNFNRHLSTCSGPIAGSPFKGHRGGWNKGLTKATNFSLEKASKTYLSKIASGEIVPKGTKHTDEFKAKQSELAFARGLGGHTSKKKIYYRMKDGKEIYLQSSFEIKFAVLLDEMGIEWSRPDPFIYIGNDGKKHRYYPDFKIGSIFIDTKNDYLAVKDALKIELVKNQCNIDLRIIQKVNINKEYIATLV